MILEIGLGSFELCFFHYHVNASHLIPLPKQAIRLNKLNLLHLQSCLKAKNMILLQNTFTIMSPLRFLTFSGISKFGQPFLDANWNVSIKQLNGFLKNRKLTENFIIRILETRVFGAFGPIHSPFGPVVWSQKWTNKHTNKRTENINMGGRTNTQTNGQTHRFSQILIQIRTRMQLVLIKRQTRKRTSNTLLKKFKQCV